MSVTVSGPEAKCERKGCDKKGDRSKYYRMPLGVYCEECYRNWKASTFEAGPSAIKFDDAKNKVELLSTVAMEEIAKVMTLGAQKYSAHNWRKGFAWSRILGALLRHTFAFMRGEDLDPETGLSHMAHAGCCVMFLLEHQICKLGTDDRFKEVRQ